MANLEAGAAKVDITPAASCWMEGYGSRYENGPKSTGVHDPLHARAVVIEAADDTVALVSCDLCNLDPDTAEAARAIVCGPLDMPPEHVMVVTTHTHAGPVSNGHDRHGKTDREWLECLAHRIAEAILLAALRIQPATVSVLRGESHVAMNRQQALADGMVQLGAAPEKPTDTELIVLAIDTAETLERVPIARLVNYNCHNTTLGPGNSLISGDYAGQAMSAIEDEIGGGVVCPFINGGSGNADPFHRVLPDANDPRVAEVAEAFAEDVRKTLSSAERAELGGDSVAGAFRDIDLPRKVAGVEAGLGRTKRIRAQGLRIGEALVLASPNEVVCEIMRNIKAHSPAPTTLTAGYCYNAAGPWHPARDGVGGYIPAAAHYDHGGYEVRVSPYSEKAEAVYVREMLALAAALHGGGAREADG